MKKVLTVTHSFPDVTHPAKGIFILDELRLLKEDISFKIAVVNTYFKNRKLKKADYDSLFELQRISYFSLPFKGIKQNKGRFISKKLENLSDFKSFDIVHAHFLTPAGLIAPYINKPTVITVHGSDWHSYKNDESWFNVFKKSLMSSSSIIAVSDALKNDIIHRIPEVADKTHYIPHSVDPFWLEMPLSNPQNNEVISIVTVASIIPIKGIIHLIDALQNISTTKKIELTIFSIQKDEHYLKKVTQKIQSLPSNITVIIKEESPREIIREAYHKAHFSILPSLSEGFGLSIIEANACGLPVISTYSGGPESIIDKENGMLIESGNSRALSKAMEEIILSLTNIDRLSIREHVKNKFSPEARKRKILSIYHTIVN